MYRLHSDTTVQSGNDCRKPHDCSDLILATLTEAASNFDKTVKCTAHKVSTTGDHVDMWHLFIQRESVLCLAWECHVPSLRLSCHWQSLRWVHSIPTVSLVTMVLMHIYICYDSAVCTVVSSLNTAVRKGFWWSDVTMDQEVSLCVYEINLKAYKYIR